MKFEHLLELDISGLFSLMGSFLSSFSAFKAAALFAAVDVGPVPINSRSPTFTLTLKAFGSW